MDGLEDLLPTKRLRGFAAVPGEAVAEVACCVDADISFGVDIVMRGFDVQY